MGEQPAGAFELSGSEEQQAEDGQTADPPPLPATALAASSSPPDSDFRRSTHTLEEAADEGLPTAGAHGNRGTVASSWGGGAPEGLLNAETGQPRSVQRRSDSSCIVNRSELSSGCHEDPQLLRVQEHNPQEWLGQETAAREDTAAAAAAAAAAQQQQQEPEQQDQQTSEPCGEMSVAVKTFRQRDSQGAQRSLYAELSVLSLLRHPNVLLLLGVVGPPVYGLVTEYVSGGSLFDLLHKQRVSLPLMRVVKLAREVALGMSYLHEKGVMHCDLKSPNILLTNNGEVRLCDFGLATIVEAAGGPDWWTAAQEQQQQHEQQQQQDPQAAHLGCVGTHHWMAPEILRGEAFTFAADVYSFGVVLWEMLVGDMPFAGIGSPSHLITVVGYGGVTPPLDKIPRPLRRFLRSCLQPDPSLRPNFAACAQLLQQLYTANLLDVEVDLNSLLGLGS
ncbi:probable serine/threonine-protein kinase DDB_G0267514 [Cyclospora cayetanensis]|uniref:Probable serine/threonine-protein kinase DDB_G0267514 n=1 Tax=Cyclospora cayetanensis TaxID=88456 RepID=A0A6P6RVV3_9EIME|nr:probable serine/threonine-protein kinase DDB_G0267514 [Cyclospora cayetanensis]